MTLRGVSLEMTNEAKNLWDVILSIITMLGAGVAFWFGLQQWRRGQDWQDALLALRDHASMGDRPRFEGAQATVRDAYHSLLSFFGRLELAISTKLVDAAPAVQYFRYWLEHFLAFDK